MKFLYFGSRHCTNGSNLAHMWREKRNGRNTKNNYKAWIKVKNDDKYRNLLSHNFNNVGMTSTQRWCALFFPAISLMLLCAVDGFSTFDGLLLFPLSCTRVWNESSNSTNFFLIKIKDKTKKKVFVDTNNFRARVRVNNLFNLQRDITFSVISNLNSFLKRVF